MSNDINKFKIADNFNLAEFQCPCCNTVKLEPYLVNLVQALRFALNCKIVITSGYRCLKHNKVVGGCENSRHTLGRAADFILKSYNVSLVLELCKKIGFTFCYYDPVKMFFHVDIGAGD